MRLLAVPLIPLLLCGLNAGAQDEQKLRSELLNRTVVVRDYYVGSNLKFDQSGKLLTPGERSFGQVDARIYVTGVHLRTDALIMEGQRTYAQYDPKAGQYRVGLTSHRVSIEIALSGNRPAMDSALESLKKVFLTTPELQSQCSVEEQTRFQKYLPKPRSKGESKGKQIPDEKAEQAPDAQSIADLERVCTPTGEAAYLANRGIQKPVPLATPDPAYSAKGLKNHTQGGVVLMIIIDEKGRASTPYVTRSLEPSLDLAAVQAVERWRFQPATFQGSPVPVAINVEVNFRLY
jgi:TonB family protein